MLARLILLAGLFAAALLPSQALAERRVALVVGNAQYTYATALRNPRNDATDIADALKRLGFEVVLGLDLDQQNFAATLEKFTRLLDNADVGLFFYAGHGLQLSDKNYLVSTNAKLDSEFLIPSETVQLDSIVRLMESKTPTNLIFLDACRNNPLTDNLKRNLLAMNRAAVLGRGLARIEPTARDTLIAYSAAPGQVADDGSDRNSPFTSALLKYLPKPGLEVSVMLKDVAADVLRQTSNAQRPQQLSDMSRTFYFVSADAKTDAPPAKVATAPSGTDDRALDVAYWNSVQSSNDCDAVRSYRQRFPNGLFVDLAAIAERRLCASRRITVLDASTNAPEGASAPAAPSVSASAAPSASAPVAPPPPPAAATSAPAPTAVANLPDPAAKPAAVPDRELALNAQRELSRLGCMTDQPDGNWSASSQESVRRFNQYAKTKLDGSEPTDAMLTALRDKKDRVCPLQCDSGYKASGNTCVAIKAAPEPKQKKAVQRAPRPAPVERADGGVQYVPARPQPMYPAGPSPTITFGGGGVGIAIPIR